MGLWGCGQRAALSTNPSGRAGRAELSGPRGIDRLCGSVEAGEAARPVEDGEPAVGISVHAHGRLDVVVAMALRRDLQGGAVPIGAIVAGRLAAFLDAHDVLQRPAGLSDVSPALPRVRAG